MTTSATTTSSPAAGALTVSELAARRGELTVIDVRSPAEYAGGHVEGALNVPLERLAEAVPALRDAAARNGLAVVCATGGRSAQAVAQLTAAGVPASDVPGGTSAWQAAGHPMGRVEGARQVWAMDRQVRLTAGSLVLTGLIAGRRFPRARLLSGAIAGGLVFSAVSNTCAMAKALGKLPYNRPATGAPAFEQTLSQLHG